MPSEVTWLGEEILVKTLAAAEAAIDKCTEAAAEDARQNHWWGSRTGDLERNTFNEPASTDGLEVSGRFGSSLRADGFYGLFLERKTPWLRPAADRAFRQLPFLIRGLARWT